MEQENTNVARSDDNNVASVSYDPSEQSILASNKPSLLDYDSYLVVSGDSFGDITKNGLSGSSDVNTAAAAAAAKIAEAKAAPATAEFPAANAAAGQNLQPAFMAALGQKDEGRFISQFKMGLMNLTKHNDDHSSDGL